MVGFAAIGDSESGDAVFRAAAAVGATIAGVEGLTAQTYTVRSTIIPQLQRAVDGRK